MTKAQNALYFREWGAARSILIARHGWTAAQADEHRHELHRQALGKDKSSKAFTNRDLDVVLATFRAIAQPADLDTQIRKAEQPELRCRVRLDQLTTEMGLTPDYVEAMTQQMFRRPLADLTEAQMHKVLAALDTYQRRRAATASSDDTSGDPF